MELPDPYLAGAVSLLESLGKKVIVQLRDSRTLIGILSSIDQFGNLVLDETIERIHVDKCYGDIPRGVFLIRGENVVLTGEIDETKKVDLKEVDVTEILNMQQEKIEEKKAEIERRVKILADKGYNISEEKMRYSELLLEDIY
uniref:U6 snRNA-associated Sm-like protein LSm1 n=1 Tax=Parastrongyloides trichosuri TaxID=131310 RepID=A0A0N4ZS30_PARTI